MAKLYRALLLAGVLVLSHGASCNIAGFEEFCSYWNSCTIAPYESVMKNGQCLYGRVVGLGKAQVVANVALAGAFRRVMFVQGPDAVVKAAGRHCTPAGRGRMLLNVGWNNPSVSGMFAYNVFVRPCANMLGAPPSTLPWTPESPPISADWEGVRQALKAAYGNVAPLEVWDNLATQYSYAGGGLGPAGLWRYSKLFLEVCTFGTYNTAGCCNQSAGSIPDTYQRLSDAFTDAKASSSTTDYNYTDATVLRAFLSNAMALNPFFNGDGRTFDGCTGHYSVMSNTEYLLPNKHNGTWGASSDLVTIGEVSSGGKGFSFVWGPASVCNGSATTCDFDDGTTLSTAACETSYGTYPPKLIGFIFGGATAPCAGRSLSSSPTDAPNAVVSSAVRFGPAMFLVSAVALLWRP